MYLAKIKYKSNKGIKITIAVILGRKRDKVVFLLDSFINKNDAQLIKKNAGRLKRYTITNKISWVKQHLPDIYKKAYRELNIANVELLESFPIE